MTKKNSCSAFEPGFYACGECEPPKEILIYYPETGGVYNNHKQLKAIAKVRESGDGFILKWV